MYTAIVCILWFGGNFILIGTDDGRRADRLFELCSAGAQLGHDVLRRVSADVPVRWPAPAASVRCWTETARPGQRRPTPVDADSRRPASTLTHVSFKYNADAEKDALSDITLHIPGGCDGGHHRRHRRGQNDARTADSAACTTPPRAPSGSAGSDVRRLRPGALRDAVGIVLQKNLLFSGTDPRQPADGAIPTPTDDDLLGRLPRRPCGRISGPDAGRPGHRPGPGRRATSRAGRSSASASPGRCSSTPKVLIFDDSTSAVDTATEAGIRHALAGLTAV